MYLGQGWDTEWDSSKGPYVWMWSDAPRRTALLIATAAGTAQTTVDAKVRWVTLPDDPRVEVYAITLS